ncbi:hypothetical protein CMK18_19680 [Candidatus Poribacteria bacterium]|nr:hypothetical protein [Candidatus Poribacteria bacterium]
MFWGEIFRNPYDKRYNLSFIRSTDIHENSNIRLDDKSSKRQKSQKNNLQNLATDNTRKIRGLLTSFAQMAVGSNLR